MHLQLSLQVGYPFLIIVIHVFCEHDIVASQLGGVSIPTSYQGWHIGKFLTDTDIQYFLLQPISDIDI